MADWTGLVRFSDGNSHLFNIEADDLEKATAKARTYTAGVEIMVDEESGKVRKIYSTSMIVSIEIRQK